MDQPSIPPWYSDQFVAVDKHDVCCCFLCVENIRRVCQRQQTVQNTKGYQLQQQLKTTPNSTERDLIEVVVTSII